MRLGRTQMMSPNRRSQVKESWQLRIDAYLGPEFESFISLRVGDTHFT
jgi:hypothetical protein